MEIYLKVTVCIVVAAVLGVVLQKQGVEISILLTIAVCCMVMLVATTYLEPILDFCRRLIHTGKIETELVETMLKVVGIGLISQIAGLVCADAGKQSLSKVLQILTTAVILCLSVPILEEMLSLIELILGEV